MSRRLSLIADYDQLRDQYPGFNIDREAEDKIRFPRYNLAPPSDLLVVPNDSFWTMRASRWGLIPAWAKEKSVGDRLIQAEVEKIMGSKSFEYSFKHRRCLILATGFYLWDEMLGHDRQTPHYYTLKSREIFAIAGLWNHWHGQSEEIHSSAIITTRANDLVARLYHRMPAILPREYHDGWLAPELSGEESAFLNSLEPYPDAAMECWEVAPDVNDPKVEGPECIVQVDQG